MAGANVTVGDAPPAPEVTTRAGRMTDLMEPILERHGRLAEWLLYLAVALAAWKVRFLEDDAFITYRFSRNLAQGRGLVFNPGEKVEGYTNFLWTVIHAIPEKLGWNTPAFSQVLGIVLIVATTAVSLRFARNVLGSATKGFLATMVLVANMTFLAYATGGMETMLQTLCITGVAALLIPTERPNPGLRQIGAGLLAGLAVLTRLDSTVLVAGWFLAIAWFTWRAAVPAERVKQTAVTALRLGVPVLLLVVPWLVWKSDFYGSLLPNTQKAKSAANPIVPFLYGIFYLFGFFMSYGGFLLIGRFRRHREAFFAQPAVRLAFVVVPLWFLYICVVGADFMEYRFMVPILPVLALLAGELIDHIRAPKRQTVLVVVLLGMSAFHRVAPNFVVPVLTFTELDHWPASSQTTWSTMGKLLHREFPGELEDPKRPVTALAALGVIGYYSDLRTIDLVGLTDAYVAEHGEHPRYYYPGHVRIAPIDYLLRRDVSLVIGDPLIWQDDPEHIHSYRLSQVSRLWPVVDLRKLPDTAKVLEIPLVEPVNGQGGWNWLMIYLQPNAQVDAAIARNHWRVVPIERTCSDADMDLPMRIAGTKSCG